MIGKVLAALVICALVVFGIVWVMSGGLARGIEYAKTISNPIAFIMGNPNGEPFKLPGQPDLMTGPDMGLSAGSTYENAIYDTNYGGISDASTSPPIIMSRPIATTMLLVMVLRWARCFGLRRLAKTEAR
jgi:hypothetical protein